MKTLFPLFYMFSAMTLSAAIDVITLPYGESCNIASPAKVASIECFSTVEEGTYSLKRETILSGERQEITSHALTNFTYSVVTTNTLGAATTNTLSRPHPLPFPETMTLYWTNSLITSHATTNVIPCVTAVFTNDVSSGSYIGPGDILFTLEDDTFRGKLYIYLER